MRCRHALCVSLEALQGGGIEKAIHVLIQPVAAACECLTWKKRVAPAPQNRRGRSLAGVKGCISD